MVEYEDLGVIDGRFWCTSSEIWISVLWSGTVAGNRLLVMPNEEAVPVNPRIYYQSNLDSFCNYTSEIITAGLVYMISFDYNQTVAIRFSTNDSSRVYNVYTLARPEDYEPVDLVVPLSFHLDELTNVSLVCAGFGLLAVFLAVRVRQQ